MRERCCWPLFSLSLFVTLKETLMWWSSTWNRGKRGRNLPVWISPSTTAASTDRESILPLSLFISALLILPTSSSPLRGVGSYFCCRGNRWRVDWQLFSWKQTVVRILQIVGPPAEHLNEYTALTVCVCVCARTSKMLQMGSDSFGRSVECLVAGQMSQSCL